MCVSKEECWLPCSWRSFRFVSLRDMRQFKMPIICFTALLTGLDLWSYITSSISITVLSCSQQSYTTVNKLPFSLWNSNLKATTFSFSFIGLHFLGYSRLDWVFPKQNHYKQEQHLQARCSLNKPANSVKTVASSFLDPLSDSEGSNTTSFTSVQQLWISNLTMHH